MDTIFFNGTIRTLDQAIPQCSALAVKNGVIVRMGSDEEILALSGPGTEKIDLGGKLMLPGFTDSHMHLVHYANMKASVSLSTAGSLDEVIERCRGAVPEARKKGGWVAGIGFNENDWTERRFPTRDDLDKIADDIPVTVRRACYHVSVLNSKALELLGLDGEKPETTVHHMTFDENGRPTGTVQENSQALISKCMGVPSLAEIKALIESGCRDAAAKGIVEIHTDDFEGFAGNQAELIIQAYSELAEEGRLPIRIYQQCLLRDKATLSAFLAGGHRTGETHGLYKLGPLKLLTDGSLGANTAVLRQPYKNAPDTKGIHIYDDETLQELMDLAHENEMQIAVHCIGDGAIEQTLNCFEKAMDRFPRPNPRHGVVHCQITDLPLLARFRALNAIVYAQPIFVRADQLIVDDCVGSELASTSYNWRELIDLGVHVSGGSDCPVEPFDVLPNICCAVTRTDLAGSAPWYPQNRVTVDEAVRMFTYEGAYAAFEEDVRGTLSVGKLADLVVLDRNIYDIPADEIKDVDVTLTMVNGNIVFRG